MTPLRPAQLSGPHGGTAFPLPGDRGIGEAIFNQAGQGPVVVYFLGPDGRSALTPLPSDVRLAIRQPGRRGVTRIDLTPLPQAGDPLGSARFVSDKALRGDAPRDGDLSLLASLDGEEVSLPVSIR